MSASRRHTRSPPRARGAAVLLLASAAALPAVAAAQESALTPGARVRVTVIAPPHALVGTYQGTRAGALVLERGRGPVELALAQIARVERSAGRRPGLLAGGIGLLVGAAAGGAIACALNRDDYGVYCGGQDDTKVVIGAVVGGAVGGAAGALLFARERWVEVRGWEPGRRD